MRFCLFYHSLVSDWNHGNAHFLRGYAFELMRRGHHVRVFEPQDNWSLTNQVTDHGEGPVQGFQARYLGLCGERYDPHALELEKWLEDADVVIVHEWNDPALLRALGRLRKRRSFRLLFHDTHHRLVSRPSEMNAYDLTNFDAVLAFGDVLRDLYLQRGLCKRAFTWHEAADVRVFAPQRSSEAGDLVWIGNWGDDERTAELSDFLLEPVRRLKLSARVHGVRYPDQALTKLRQSGIDYGGFLPNYRAPEVYAGYRMTVHIPRRPYVEALLGVPTIRVFEALACGIPLVSAPWHDTEHLFSPGKDFLMVENGAQMTEALATLRNDTDLRDSLISHGLATIRSRHTCAHRVDELFSFLMSLGDGSLGDGSLGDGVTCIEPISNPGDSPCPLA